jgi:hypothetical protein
MVKGVSRQVVLVRPAEPKLFEQAIFILRDDVPREGITDEMLLKEANRLIRSGSVHRKGRQNRLGPLWAMGGAGITAAVWLLTSIL